MVTANAMTLDNLIQYVSDRISTITGVKLGPKQYTLVKSRLNKRLRELGEFSPERYMDYLRSNENTEVAALVSLLTTHHSYFFREYPHFEYLAKSGLQHIVNEAKAQGRNKIKVWSAACSKGQEVYSLAMFLKYHLNLIDPSMEFEIFGSDVSDECVEISRNGVYKWREIKSVPSVYLGAHWARGSGEISQYVKAKSSIKKYCKFANINLLDFQNKIGDHKFDIIFCRNVFIYFEIPQIKKIVTQLMSHLQSHGQLILGLSESLLEAEVPVKHIGHSIYASEEYVKSRNIEVVPEFSDPIDEQVLTPEGAPSPIASVIPKPIKVMCVDDSPTVLKLLEKIFKSHPDFELVATAKNGLDAKEKLKLHDIDVMTLDIHMPEQDGLQYLQSSYFSGHPPVVIVSSVAREDANLALKCFEAGAFDYIEKPSLQNIGMIEDELCTKVLSAVEMKNQKDFKVSDLDNSFKKSPIISKPSEKLRVVYAHVGNKEKLYGILKNFRAPQPPTVVFFEGIGNLIGPIKEEFTQHTVRVESLEDRLLGDLESNRIYFADASLMHDNLVAKSTADRVSILMLGKPSANTVNRSLKWKNSHLIIEDLSDFTQLNSNNVRYADQVVPLTSFVYESDKFLSKADEEVNVA